MFSGKSRPSIVLNAIVAASQAGLPVAIYIKTLITIKSIKVPRSENAFTKEKLCGS
ncbi:hypothetical protein G3A_05015 [Bacillus sp. 17376]|uniref:hypothetical protein n=1 Tax=Mesobacillus boroniphilus TaxID=308892 RepID=UPI0003C77C3B|nr:hypothetical protein [Mesobacillus boroniphilus]ESU33564.1 hypothetical protein G3A_05015 [Bacillus sp. 17376]